MLYRILYYIESGTTTGSKTVNVGSVYTFYGATPYSNSGDYVRAAFIKYNFNGTKYISGRMYYNW